jgi:hypothetical protein
MAHAAVLLFWFEHACRRGVSAALSWLVLLCYPCGLPTASTGGTSAAAMTLQSATTHVSSVLVHLLDRFNPEIKLGDVTTFAGVRKQRPGRHCWVVAGAGQAVAQVNTLSCSQSSSCHNQAMDCQPCSYSPPTPMCTTDSIIE